MINALTIDVEEYFQVTAFSAVVKEEAWGNYPSRAKESVLKTLELLDEFYVKGTFFVLGWVAERYPGIVREIHARGHEVASHGYSHKLIYNLGERKFREDLKRGKKLLEDICQENVLGYRAPSYSITKKSLWALDILMEEGFLYDSSIFPIFHDIYGMPHAERFPHEINRPCGTIKEFPLSTIELKFLGMKYRLPVAGGGYLRLLPIGISKRAIKGINDNEKQPAVLYFHTWEIDPAQPRIKGGWKSGFRHYFNLDKTAGRVKDILSSFKFAPMREILGF